MKIYITGFLFLAIGLLLFYKDSKVRTSFFEESAPVGSKFYLDVIQLRKLDNSFFYVAKNGNMLYKPHILYGDLVFNEFNDKIGSITEVLWDRVSNVVTIHFNATHDDVGVGDRVWIYLCKN